MSEASAYDVTVVDTSKVSATLADRLQSYTELLPVDADYHIAIAGGSLLGTLAAALAALRDSKSTFPLERCHFWLVDERFVPPDHADSNYYGFCQQVDARSGEAPLVPRDNIHPASTHLPDVDACATEYEDRIKRIIGERPVFDIVLLGCGEDGHVASLFPQHSSLKNTHDIVTSEHNSPKPPAERITLTLPVINNARRVLCVITGAGKADVLAAVFSQSEASKSFPLSLVRQSGDQMPQFIIDEAAAGKARPFLRGGH